MSRPTTPLTDMNITPRLIEGLTMLALRIIAGALAIAAVSCSRTPRTTPPPAEPPKPVAVVNADDLVAEYQKNALAADAKYKSQLIDVKGKVARVGRGLVGDSYVQLGGSALEDAFGVTCYLAKSAEAAAAQLKEGESITMRGVCQGLYAGQALRLFDCEIVK